MFTDDFRDILLEYVFVTPMVGILRLFDGVEQCPLLNAVNKLAKYGMISWLMECTDTYHPRGNT